MRERRYPTRCDAREENRAVHNMGQNCLVRRQRAVWHLYRAGTEYANSFTNEYCMHLPCLQISRADAKHLRFLKQALDGQESLSKKNDTERKKLRKVMIVGCLTALLHGLFCRHLLLSHAAAAINKSALMPAASGMILSETSCMPCRNQSHIDLHVRPMLAMVPTAAQSA